MKDLESSDEKDIQQLINDLPSFRTMAKLMSKVRPK